MADILTKQAQLARVLQSPGACEPLDESNIALILDDDSELSIREYSGPNVKRQVEIANDARAGANASFVGLEKEHVIFYVSDKNRIGAASSPPGADKWEGTNVGDDASKLELCPESSLTAVGGPLGVYAFFQLSDGIVGGLVWTKSGASTLLAPHEIGVKAIPGSPLSAVEVMGKVYLFYFQSDGSMHCSMLGHDVKEGWKHDVIVIPHGNIGKDDPAKRMIVSYDGKGECFTASILTKKGDVLLINCGKDGSKQKLGDIDDKGKFNPATTAECAYCGYMPVLYVRRSRFWFIQTTYYEYVYVPAPAPAPAPVQVRQRRQKRQDYNYRQYPTRQYQTN